MNIILFLIVFFTFLLIYQILPYLPSFTLREGLENEDTTASTTTTTSDTTAVEYQPYNSNDPMILAQQNAGNIEFLKKRVDDLNGMKQTIDNLTENVNKLNDEVGQLAQQQADYAQNLVGTTPPSVSGISTDTTTATATPVPTTTA